MTHTLQRILLTTIVSGLSLTVLADQTPEKTPQSPYKIDKSIETFDIHPDATYTETSEVVETALNELGISAINQADISYSNSLESLTVVEAYTLKKNGTRINVPAQNIQDRDVIDGGGPMYSDFKGKVIIFPNLEVGDKIAYTIRTEQKIAMFPHQFSLLESFDNSALVENQEINLSTPLNGLSLHSFSKGIEGGRQPDANGLAHWQWRWHNTIIPDNDDITPPDEAPTLQVTSFKDFAALAAAYEERAHAQAIVTPKIQAKADELTQGIDQPAKQANILYTWVARNIRYAGNCIGVGSVVPHAADMILENRLGDCKDHTALLQALLAAKGINSTPVLVNSTGRYTLPELPVVQYFNHVINYIPSLNIYADSTADFIPFGSLPMSEDGKMVLPTEGFSTPVETPPAIWQQYESHMNFIGTFNADGSLVGEVDDSDSPLLSSVRREYFADLDPNEGKSYVREHFAESGIKATGDIHFDNPRQASDHYGYGMTFTAENYLDLPGAGAFHVIPLFQSGLPIADFKTLAVEKPFKHSMRCTGFNSIEDYHYTIPKNLKILWLPKNVHVASVTAQYDADYKQDGENIFVHRQFEYRILPHLCSPAEFEAIRPITAAIAKDMKGQILYQMD